MHIKIKQTGDTTIYDPTCGTGGMLISSISEATRLGKDIRTIGLFGNCFFNFLLNFIGFISEILNITIIISKNLF